MGKEIKIIADSLVITDTVSLKIELEEPLNGVYIDSKELDDNSNVVVYDLDGVNKKSSKLFEAQLSECVDVFGLGFSEASLKEFYRTNLGSNSKPINIENSDLGISRGLVDGQETIIKWGQNRDVDSGTTPEDITDIGGLYVPPTANRTHQIKSTSIEDKGTVLENGNITSPSLTSLIDSAATFITSGVTIGDTVLLDTSQDHTIVTAVVSETELTVRPLHHEAGGTTVGEAYRVVTPAGTGASVCHIKLGNKDNDENFYTEFIVMNGLTNVPTTIPYYRITRMHTHGSGTNKKNVGDITATADVDTTVTAKILAGNGQTEMAFFYVPKNYTLYLDGWETTLNRDGVASDVMARVELRSQLWGVDGEVLEYGQGVSVGTAPPVVWKKPKRIAQETDVWVRCVHVSDNNVYVHSGFYGVLIKND